MVLEMEMSKTYQYRKVMKPMLERKRRARINKCLDELKDIMVECLTQEGEHITRLEKADILELTVEHMKKLRAQKQLRINTTNHHTSSTTAPTSHQLDAATKVSVAESFRAGYVHAANEVSKTLATVPGVSVDLGTQLMSHLGHRLNYLQVVVPTAVVSSSSSSPSVNNFPAVSPTSASSVSSVTASPSPIIGATTFFDHHNHNHHPQHHQSQQQQQAPPLTSSSHHLLQSGGGTHNIPVITPPPSECSSDRSCSPTPSDTGSVWRPW